MTKEEASKQMQKELEAYKAGTSSAKSYFTSMKEISSWLATKTK